MRRPLAGTVACSPITGTVSARHPGGHVVWGARRRRTVGGADGSRRLRTSM